MAAEHNGFVEDDNYYMERCGACKRENYTLAVASGLCCWCGADGRTPSQKAKQELAASLSQNDHEQA